jgi:tetratricopeptide (TPR) repeat protein
MRLPAVLAASWLLLALVGCADATKTSPDVVLVSLDTVRADVFDEVAVTEPTLARLSAGAVRFRAAATPTPLTLPAHTSLMSGLDPNVHGVRLNGQIVSTDVPLLAERLKAQGYATLAAVSAFPLDRRFGLQRGFDQYDQPAGAAQGGFSTLERDATDTVDAALNLLATSPAESFLWVHLFDPHAPYQARDIRADAPPRERYAREIAHTGRQLDRLVRALDARGRPYVMVIVADHGEGLGEHGELDHGLFLYDSTLLVPMLWYAPGVFKPRLVDGVPRLIDVPATIADLLGLEWGHPIQGISLLPSLRGQAQVFPPAYAETHYGELAYQAAPLRSLRDGRWKSIGTEETAELYDLQQDPAETADLARQDPARSDRMQFDTWQRPQPATHRSGGPDADSLRQLQSLGYLAATGEAGGPQRHPRDFAASHRRLIELQTLLGEGRDAEALVAARALHGDEPANGFAAYVLGMLELDAGRYDAARDALEVAVRIDPRNAQHRFKLGELEMRAGRYDAALQQWDAVVLLEPNRAAAWSNQSGAQARLGRWDDAWRSAAKALTLEPDDPTYIDNAATIAERIGRHADAADLLMRLPRDPSGRHAQPARLLLAQLRAGNNADATATLESLDQAPANAPVRELARAVLAARNGDPRAAEAHLQRFTDGRPGARRAAIGEFPELAAAADRAP